MSSFLVLPLFITLLPVILSLILVGKWVSSKTQKKLPPSPSKLPVLGNLHQLGNSPHHSLHSLSQKYGDLMLLHLGSIPTVIVSSASAAREILKTHDVIFSDRPQSMASIKLLYNGRDVASANYGEYWRQMKSIFTLRLLSTTKVRSFRAIREEETALMVENIRRSIPSVVNLTQTFATLTNDVVCRAALGRKYGGQGSPNFVEIIMKYVELLGEIAVGDFVPWLGWIDRLNGLGDKMDKAAKTVDQVLERILDEHVNSPSPQGDDCNAAGKREMVKDFIDVMLEVQKDKTVGLLLDRESIKAVILDAFAAGTHTSATLIEWAMSEILKHPRVLRKLQDEVRRFTQGKESVNEADLEKMEYLKAVIKETLRLHPPIPLLVTRLSREDAEVNGYDIGARTQVIINAWAIQRDPSIWEDPNEFHPERFLTSAIDFKGQHFQLIPFGAGRRICPGILFASTSAELVLANLLYAFNWALPDGAKGQELDMSESSGCLTIHRRDPLLAVATPHAFISKN